MAGVPEYQHPRALFDGPRRQSVAKMWDGVHQTTSSWDGLRRDSDLWSPDGDCYVYLYRRGTSKRGPSFRIPYNLVKAAGCVSWMFERNDHFSSGRSTPVSSSDESAIERSPISPTGKQELFIGPCGLTRQEVFEWHITTRNFFAWLLRKPLVGLRLGQALESLLERLDLYRGHAMDNLQCLLDYAKDMGYLNFVNYPDQALTMLAFAENHKVKSLYIDAFAHCVGMKERLPASSEYAHISRLTKALISRAYLEMDLHIERAAQSTGTFLEEELSSAYLGLTKPIRAHLDDFRSFLQSYSIAKYGYWPPTTDAHFSKPLYQSMHREFRFLYEYLADTSSAMSAATRQPAIGGICVLQNLEAFNERHKYQCLPYALPLVPILPTLEPESQARRVRRSLGWVSKDSSSRRMEAIREALVDASNYGQPDLMSCPLVRAYIEFEAEHAGGCDDQLFLADARRVRWILVYAMVQMLSSMTYSPPEVKNPESAPYPLCCLTLGLPPWGSDPSPSERSRKSSTASPITNSPAISSPPTPEISIQPDCDRSDYFAHDQKSRPMSVVSDAGLTNLSKSLSHRIRRTRSAYKANTYGLDPQPLNRLRSQTFANLSNESRNSTGTWSSISTSPIRSRSSMSSESLVLTMPALYWSSDNEDRAENSSSEDEMFSPVVDGVGFFTKSFDPFHLELPGLASKKELVEQSPRTSMFDDGIADPALLERRVSKRTFLRYDNPESMHHSLRI